MREPVDRGLPASQLELHYQPVVRLDGSGVYGAETFLRWRHPERGVLRAGQWLPYAIRSGAAVALSAAVLPAWAACARRLPGLVLSFNVTGWDLIDDQYVASIRAVAAEGAAGLAVEIPYLQFHPKVARAIAPEWGWLELADLDAGLASLQALGFSVWLDDFGYDGTDDEAAAVGSSVDVVKLDIVAPRLGTRPAHGPGRTAARPRQGRADRRRRVSGARAVGGRSGHRPGLGLPLRATADRAAIRRLPAVLTVGPTQRETSRS